MLSLSLPYPPSINNYYRKWNNTIVISPQGKLYRQLIWSTLWVDSYKKKKWDRKALVGDLGVEIMVFPPDKRKRDLDNIKKALFDALQHAGLYKDDYQICDDHTVRMQPVKNGLIELKIKKIGEINE